MKRIFLSFLLFNLPTTGISQPTGSLLSARVPIDLIKVTAGSDVLLVGDDHTQPAIKTFLSRQLKMLNALGFRCLAVEMLPSRFQRELDRWGGTDQDRIRQHLAQYWGEKGSGIPESLFDLIAAAKREGFRVVALDPDDDSSTDRQAVNPHWVECIRRCRIGGNGSKIIVFGGSSHFQPRPRSAFSLLKDQGIRCSILEFSGLESPRSVELEFKAAQLLGRKVPLTLQITEENHRLGMHSAFMVRDTPNELAAVQVARWVINIEPAPQIAILPSSK